MEILGDGNDLKRPTTSEEEEEEEEKSTKTIPGEIIFFEIFTRLPVKSLLQFRSVSKLWCSLMRDSSFVNQHLTRSLHRPDRFGLFISAYNKHSSKRHFLSASRLGSATAHLFTLSNSPSDSCVSLHLNGLFLIHPNGFTCTNTFAYICNPSTREFARLPAIDSILFSRSIQIHVCYNLGFDPSTNEYKVLNIRVVKPRSSERKAKAECQIFTLGTDSWRKIDPVFPFDIKGRDWLFGSKYSVCVNGAIHWLIQSENFIAAFDLREESFRIMPLPHATIPSGKLYMIQINGLLAVICPNMVEMWVLEDYENQVWIAESIIFPSSCAFPRGTIHTGEILLTPQRISRDGVFIPFYDMKNGSFRIVEITLFPELLSAVDDVEITCAGDYIESILALRRND